MLGLNKLTITPSLVTQLCDIEEFKGYWRAMDKHTTGLNLLNDFAKYGTDFHAVLNQLKDHPISTKNIKALHSAMITKGKPSTYKTADTQLIITNETGDLVGILDTAPPEQVEALLEKLTQWVNEALDKQTLPPLLIIAVFTGIFLQISPFEKGNRKLIMVWVQILMLKAGYDYAPYVVLDDIFARNASTWFRALKTNQASLENGRPDWNDWLSAFLSALQDHKNTLAKKLNAKSADLSHLPTLSAKIMALFEEHQRLQMKQIISLTRGRRATIKLRLGELLKDGYLIRHGGGRSTWYSLV